METIRQAAQLFRAGVHQQATALLEEVQRISSPTIVEVCTALLQEPLSAEASYTQFYAARILRCAVARDWNTHWHCQSASIVEFALRYLSWGAEALCQPACKPLLSEMVSLWCSVWKLRCGVRISGGSPLHETFAMFTAALEELTASAQPTAAESVRYVVRTLLAACIDEFGDVTRGRSNAVGGVLSVTAHEQCRRDFRDKILPGLASAVFAWGLHMQTETPRTATALLVLWYGVLSWNFSNTPLASGCDAAGSDKVPEQLPCEGPVWMQLFGASIAPGQNVTLVDVLMAWLGSFNADDEQNRQLVLQCLLQFCGVTCADWSLETKAAHVVRTAQALFRVASNALSSSAGGGRVAAQDVHVACSGLHRMILAVDCVSTVFQTPNLPEVMFKPLLELTQSTIAIIHDTNYTDDEALIESTDYLLRTWLTMVTSAFNDVTVLASLADTPIVSSLSEASSTVLKVFVHYKTVAAAAVSAAEESNHSLEYGESHTKLLALLGRDQPASTATFLVGVLKVLAEDLLRRLGAGEAVPEHVYEGLWFLLSIAAHFFADGSDSERNSIPNSIVSLALHWERQYPGDEMKQEASNEVFGLMRQMIALATELQPFALRGSVSPALCQGVLQVFAHYIGAYMFPDDMMQLDFCNSLSTAFRGGVDVADSALRFVAASLSSFRFDSDVTKACSRLLVVMTEKPPEFGAWAVTHEAFDYFVRLACDEVPEVRLPGKIKGSVIGFLVSVCPIDRVSTLIVNPIAAALAQPLQRAELTNSSQLLDVDNIVEAVDSLAGAFSALRTEERTRVVFSTLAPLVSGSAVIAQKHGAHKLLLSSILRLMHTIVESCSFLASSSFLHVVELGIVCIQTTKSAMEASKQSTRTLSRESASQEEDERVEVLTAAALFVQAVATWGLMDLNMEDDPSLSSSRADCIAELSVRGLLTVLAFCDASVLAIPMLRDTVFSLLQEVSSTFTGRFLSVSTEEANALLSATNFGLNSSVPQLNQSSCKVMEAIAAHHIRTSQGASPSQSMPLLHQFLTAVATTLSAAQIELSVCPWLANTLFALAGAIGAPETLQIIFNVFSGNQLLESAFQQLQGVMQSTNFLSNSREVRNKFSRDVEVVFLAVRGTRIQ